METVGRSSGLKWGDCDPVHGPFVDVDEMPTDKDAAKLRYHVMSLGGVHSSTSSAGVCRLEALVPWYRLRPARYSVAHGFHAHTQSRSPQSECKTRGWAGPTVLSGNEAPLRPCNKRWKTPPLAGTHTYLINRRP